MIDRRRLLSLLAVALTVPAQARERATWSGAALGAEVSITLLGERDAVRAALQAAQAAILRLEGLFSLYRADSLLARLNASGHLASVPEEFTRLLLLVDRAHAATRGRFAPSVQALWRALAAGRDGAAERGSIGWDKVLLRQDGIALPPGMALTFNGIAQGFVTDSIAEMLMTQGFDHQLVDIGELRAGAGDWRIGLFDPQLGHFSTLTASRSAFATSSPQAMPLPGGEGHILGPHGEKPQWSSVIVEAESAAAADALSAAFCLMRRDEIMAMKAAWPGLRSVTLVTMQGEIATL